MWTRDGLLPQCSVFWIRQSSSRAESSLLGIVIVSKDAYQSMYIGPAGTPERRHGQFGRAAPCINWRDGQEGHKTVPSVSYSRVESDMLKRWHGQFASQTGALYQLETRQWKKQPVPSVLPLGVEPGTSGTARVDLLVGWAPCINWRDGKGKK